MSHYTIRYTNGSREELDEKAISDMKEYLTEKQWDAFMQIAASSDVDIDQLNFYFGMVGVKGRPFHAFCRKYFLDKYLVWMRTGEDPQLMDDRGFHIEPKEGAVQ